MSRRSRSALPPTVDDGVVLQAGARLARELKPTVQSPTTPSPNRLQPHSHEIRDRAFKLYSSGKPLLDIAQTLSVPVNTVRQWSSRGKWKARRAITTHPTPGKTTYLLSNMDDTIEQQLAELCDLSFGEKQDKYRELTANEAMRVALLLRNMPAAMLLQHADKVAKLDATARKALNLEESKPSTVINIGFLQSHSQRAKELETRDQLTPGKQET